MSLLKNIVVVQKVPLERVSDLLCSAWEGGSAYWCEAVDYIAPKKWEFESTPKAEEGKHYGYDYPLNGGVAILLDKEEDKKIRLTLGKVTDGLRIMAEKFPSHYGDFISENEDSITGDVFLQCCLFGDVIYG